MCNPRNGFQALALAGALATLGCGTREARDRSLERVQGAGALRVAIDPTYPPMAFTGADGQPAGFDIDLAHELARRLGVRAEFLVMDWAGIIAGLQSGRYDVIISAMNVTPDRSRQADFVEYLRLSQVFVCRPGTAVRDEEDLAGKVVAVQANTTSHTWAAGLPGRGIAPRAVRAFPSATDPFNAVKSGQAEVVVTDEPVGRYYARRDRDFRVTGQALEPKPVGIALQKGSEALRDAIAAALEDMRRDGTFGRISEDWFGVDLGSPPTEEPGFWSFSGRVVLPRLLRGMWLTVQLTLWGGCCGTLLGLVVALGRISRNRLLARLAAAYVTLFRGTPLLLQILFVYFALPPLLGVRLGAMASAVLALSLNTAAYVSEIMRAAIESIDKGQMEAARALGMSHGQAMRRVVLPQTYRRIIPPLVNEFSALSKDTSLVMVVALPELLYETQRLAASYLRPWEVYVWAALGYLAVVLALSALAGRLERRLAAREA
jgi:His/Glu/Gln/Arg/opine family amino acid ABC transporter permease subunit